MPIRPSLRLALLPAAIAAAFAGAPVGAVAADGPISTLAGTTAGNAGDGGPAAAAQLNQPRGLARAADGRLLIADTANGSVREVGTDGIIRTVVDSSVFRQVTQLSGAPVAVAYETTGDTILVLDRVGHYLARVTRAPNANALATVTPIAGTRDTPGNTGDGGPATAARLNGPTTFLRLADGAILIADTGNNRIRRVVPGGTITAWAGTGESGAGGDGGPATDARLNAPTGLALMLDGSVLIADTGNNRIRRVTPSGTITTVAGTGTAGFSNDGSPATTALLSAPTGVAPLGTNGAFLVADTGNSRLRRVTPLGTIFTISGGAAGLAGDGGPASGGQLSGPTALLATPSGGFLVADSGNSRIRQLASDGALPGPAPGRSLRISPISGSVRALLAGRAGVTLREPDLIQLGSRTDTEAGQATIETATAAGTVRTATVSGGEFATEQPRGPVETVFKLTASLNGCRASEGGPVLAGAAKAGAKKPKKKRKRRARKIFVQSDGGHRTNGRYADAVVRGTKWSVQDFCTSTRVTVFEGAVEVRDRVKKKRVLIPAGKRYVARRAATK
ncbi:MAG: hypothetical protein J7513_04800 [Solirubrobacteraceae bacterium]|nr:hypothetical protein [Solirubrobacteraceae bacterium]